MTYKSSMANCTTESGTQATFLPVFNNTKYLAKYYSIKWKSCVCVHACIIVITSVTTNRDLNLPVKCTRSEVKMSEICLLMHEVSS